MKRLGSALLFIDIILLFQAISFLLLLIVPETGMIKVWKIGKEIIILLCFAVVVITRDGFPSTERMSEREKVIWKLIQYVFFAFYALWAFRYYVFDPESTETMVIILCKMISIFVTISGLLFIGAQIYFMHKKVW